MARSVILRRGASGLNPTAAFITSIGVIHMTCRAAMVLVAFILVSAPLTADNWPQWRGPQLNGHSAETNLPVKWSKTEGITWKLAMPERSGSTPIVWGDSIFLNVG